MSFEQKTLWSVAQTAVLPEKRARGKAAYLSGLAAEDGVVRAYEARGATLVERRWRGMAGEIDLIFLESGVYVFCEVKAARNFDVAMARLRPAQMLRIHKAASEYLKFTPQGQLTEVRFDLAVVDGQGMCEVVDGAFSHF